MLEVAYARVEVLKAPQVLPFGGVASAATSTSTVGPGAQSIVVIQNREQGKRHKQQQGGGVKPSGSKTKSTGAWNRAG